MRRMNVLFLTFALGGLLLLSGCLSTQDGPSLFDDSEDLNISDNQEGYTTSETENPATFTEGGEFGNQLAGTQCLLQLHGGCVPFDYYLYEGTPLGLHFMYPQNWIVTAASEQEVAFTPVDRSGEADPTQLFVWRQTGINRDYEAIQTTLEENGKATTGPYDVTWEIYTGEWNGLPVMSEWVWLIYNEDDRSTNYVFVLVTEPENFDSDQAVLKGAVSSVVEKTF